MQNTLAARTIDHVQLHEVPFLEVLHEAAFSAAHQAASCLLHLSAKTIASKSAGVVKRCHDSARHKSWPVHDCSADEGDCSRKAASLARPSAPRSGTDT